MLNKKTLKQGLGKQAEESLKILYANVNGIGDKTINLESAAQLAQADIIAIVEAKQISPKLNGYRKWISKERTNMLQ